MKLRLKLMLAPVVSGAMMLVVLGAALWTSHRSLDALERSKVKADAEHALTMEQRDKLAGLHTQLYRTMTIIGSMDDKAVKGFRDQLAQQLAERVRKLGEEAAALPDGDAARAKLTEVAALAQKYQKAADSAVDLATVDPNTGVAAMQGADTEFRAIVALLDQVQVANKARGEAEAAVLQASADRAGMAISAFGILAMLASLVFAWFAQRRVVVEMTAGSRAAQRVAAGRLDELPHSDSTDEVGDLMRALGAMVGQLRGTIQSVQQVSDSIGTASTEIASGNQDLSHRTEQTASSLQQTASSMEQLTGTVRQSADSAATANQLASSAAQVAQRGGEVVAQVVDTMNEINSSSKKIADIIGVIDGIAFQTNILALNAAVEAARAGEQGRGFAVVAGEVRSLAHRSAEAAREIKTLIGTSVGKVEVGSKLVKDAGATMGEIMASVRRVTDVIGEISAATSEQSSGLGQINQAVVQLDEMTQRNAALVEQSAAAAESLREQAGRLSGLVSAFDLGGGRSGTPMPDAVAPPVRAAAPTRAVPGAAVAAPAPAASKPKARIAAAAAAAPALAAGAPRAAAVAAPLAVAVAAASGRGGDEDWETF